MTLDEAVAIVAANLGVIDEEAINNMSYVFFEDVLAALGNRLIFDAVSNYAGNSFAKDSWSMIMEKYPLDPKNGKEGAMNSLGDFFNKSNITVTGSGKTNSRMPQTYKQRKKGNNGN